MNPLRVLIVEDEKGWVDLFRRICERLSNEPVVIKDCRYFDDAIDAISRSRFDLAIIDIRMKRNKSRTNDIDLGLELVGRLEDISANAYCAVVMVTGAPSIGKARFAYQSPRVFEFVEKKDFTLVEEYEEVFKGLLHDAILDALLKKADDKANNRFQLTMTFNSDRFVSSELSAKTRRSRKVADNSPHFEVKDIIGRANRLNQFLHLNNRAMQVQAWREECKGIGEALFDKLNQIKQIRDELSAARALKENDDDLWLECCTPAPGLGIPFELLRASNDPFCLQHVITRRLIYEDADASRKPEAFREFIREHHTSRSPMRMLIVGANADGELESVQHEVSEVKRVAERLFSQLGIPLQVRLLVGEEASYQSVREEITNEYHLIHYAGHGIHNELVPEAEESGIELRDGDGFRLLTASEMRLLLTDSPVRLVFLSSCLGARTDKHEGYGDFYGVFDALARSDIPIAIGYRWVVNDQSAPTAALAFYQSLFTTFCPGTALLRMRREAASGSHGRNDPTWASPIMMMQCD